MRPPQQERSRRTLDRIVEAALEIVAERGVEAASVQGIVDRAGSSVGSFYARFDGKGDLMRYLEGRVWAEATRRWDEGIATGTWDRGELERMVEGLVHLLVRVERTDASRRGALGGRYRGGDDPGGAPGEAREGAGEAPASAEAFRRHIAEDVRRLLLARRDEIGHPEPERAVRTLLRVLIGAVRELGGEADDSDVVRELVRVAVGYLGLAGEEAPAERTPVDFFDVWG